MSRQPTPRDEVEEPIPARETEGRRPTSRKATSRETTGRTPRKKRPPRRRRISFLRDVVDDWWERLFSAVFGGTWDEQPHLYESGRGGRDYLLNTLGSVAWGMLFPLLTIVSSQLSGAERAGEFNMAFTTATLLLYVGNYGVKTYQVSDIEETHAFSSYVVQRTMTCLLMLALGMGYCVARQYSSGMLAICAGAFGYRAVDAFADVFEGRLQQADKLYLAGISTAVRAVVGISAFSLVLLVSRNLAAASIAMAIAALASLLLLTVPLARLETTRSRSWSMLEVSELFRDCFPAFLALFLFTLIENVPKYAMEGALPYRDQVIFSALFFPAQALLMAVGFIYKPQLVRLATFWSDPHKRMRFDLVIGAMLLVCALVTLGGIAFARWAAVPLNSMLYGTDFEPYRRAQYFMVVAGGLSAAIDFLYQIITVMRRQAAATRIYLAATVGMVAAAVIGVRLWGFDGAIWSYLGVMAALFVALGIQYLLIRVRS